MAADPRNFQSKNRFGEAEKTGWKTKALFITFVVLGLGAILAMVVTNKPEKKLVCRTDVPASLTGFGNCTAE